MKPFKPGKPPSARAANRAFNNAEQVSGFSAGGAGGGGFSGPTGFRSYENPNQWFFAEITSVPGGSGSGSGCGSGSGSGSGPCPEGYGFRQIVIDECDAWADASNESTGCQIRAYELNDQDVAVGTRVVMWPTSDPSVFIFTTGGGVGGGAGLIIRVATCVKPFFYS